MATGGQGRAEKLISLQETFEAFNALLNGGGDIRTKDFEEACRPILLLVDCFGIVARPVHSDLSNKMDSLQQLREESKGSHYKTLRSLVEFETRNGIEKNHPRHGYHTGCYALSRLEWTMEYMSCFFERLADLESDSDSLYMPASGAYEESISRYHNWLIKKAAYLIMNFLPSKTNLLNHFEGSDGEIKEQCRFGAQVCRKMRTHLVEIFKEFSLEL